MDVQDVLTILDTLAYIIQATGKRRKDVEGAPAFPQVFEELEALVEATRQQYKCSAVVWMGWNLKAVDYPWLKTMCLKHDIAWPSTWKWGWDPLQSIK